MPYLLYWKKCYAAALLLLFAECAFGFSQDPLTVHLPDLPAMPKSEWFWVGQHMAINGIPMSIKMFTYSGKKEDVIQFYHSLWKSQGNGKTRDNDFGDRYVLGYELEGYYYTVQFQVAGGTISGKLVVTPTPLNYHSSKRTELPLPPKTNVKSKVESLDNGRREETITATCYFGVSYVVDYYKDSLADDGWKPYSGNGSSQDSAVLSFQRGSELLQLTVKGLQHNNSQKSRFLINWIK